MIVGEAPGFEDERRGEFLCGAPGALLTNILHSIGLSRASCFVTSVCRVRPPGGDISLWLSENKKNPFPGEWIFHKDSWIHPHVKAGMDKLEQELALVQPRIVLALGNLALWSLTGYSGVGKWRGSRIETPRFTVIPALHPSAILRQMDLAPVFQMDLRRVKNLLEGTQKPQELVTEVAPSFIQASSRLRELLAQADLGPLTLAGDIETRAKFITCWGVAWTPTNSLTIPFITANPDFPFYWSADEEAELVYLINQLHRHPSITWLGQNYLYDCQYYHRHWLALPRKVIDTMIGHHSIYSTMRKGLDFLSSMYCRDHVYWKDESKDWDPSVGEKQLWAYNGKDCCATFEAGMEILETKKKLGLDQHFAFQQELFFPVLRMMIRGVRINHAERKRLRGELIQAALLRQDRINYLVGHELNPKSPKKVMEFFYSDMKIPGIKALATDKLTVNSQALSAIATREPLLRPLCQALAESRSIGVFLSTFIEAELDDDHRMRCSFSIAGTDSYRFSSSQNAFNSGMNLQNIPKETKQKVAAKDYIELPNIRKLFIPDPGYEFFDLDLDRADLQVVVWEAEDADLKFALREGLDMHLFNAAQVWGLKAPVDELKESHPNYKEHKARFGKWRQLAKAAVHATNYGVGDRKLAMTLGITVHQASQFRAKWFAAHPGILAWHKRTEEQGTKRGYIQNILGARYYILGRFDLPAALAWTPQSVVGGVINRGLINIDRGEQAGEHKIQVLLQVHDSLAGQYPIAEREKSLAALAKACAVEVPYSDPLIIPTGIQTSPESWGACK
jgi:DNA polymerase I-like protein with 3'-5' exonuclease and polymerase domains/uracil-DNA glycosylase